jgi:alpha-beta hydrolase superfamily lysophospholipase
LNPTLPDDEFEAAVRIAQAEFDRHRPDVVVGSSRGGAVAMNINSGSTPLVLLCPAWKRWGAATKVTPGTVILQSEPLRTSILFLARPCHPPGHPGSWSILPDGGKR